MSGQKIVYIIPGFRQKPTHRAYKELSALLKKEGYSPVLISIPWRKTTISENTAYFLEQYRKTPARKKYILGFSFGAMIAFLAATKVQVSGLILCSLSPYFKEDIANIPSHWMTSITNKRYKDFITLRCSSLAKKIKAPQTHLLYGSNEEEVLIRRANTAYRHITSKRKSVIPVQKAEHNIGDKRYLQMIQQVSKLLN